MSLRTTTIDAAAAADHATTLAAMHAGDLELMVVRGVFDASFMTEVEQRLSEPANVFDDQLLGRSYHEPHLATIGTPISRFGDDYFDRAALFHAGCERLFKGGPGFGATVYSLLEILSGTSVRRAAADGSAFGGWNIRVLPPGGEIARHAGHMFFDWAGYGALGDEFDRRTQLSFYVVIAPPDQGGGLEVEPLDGGDTESFSLAAGDMVLFDEGRHMHRVDHVRGARRRITIGGFLGYHPATDCWVNWA